MQVDIVNSLGKMGHLLHTYSTHFYTHWGNLPIENVDQRIKLMGCRLSLSHFTFIPYKMVRKWNGHHPIRCSKIRPKQIKGVIFSVSYKIQYYISTTSCKTFESLQLFFLTVSVGSLLSVGAAMWTWFNQPITYLWTNHRWIFIY